MIGPDRTPRHDVFIVAWVLMLVGIFVIDQQLHLWPVSALLLLAMICVCWRLNLWCHHRLPPWKEDDHE